MAKAVRKREVKKQKSRFARYFWGLVISAIIGVFSIFLLAFFGFLGDMPGFERLENPETNLATEIISSDGKTLGKFYLDENRTPVFFNDLPSSLVNALVATEDERYYQHSGIDIRATVRAVAYLGKKGGASTITQQLAKQLFNKREGAGFLEKMSQKIREWVIAIQIERQYTKEEIITMYLNIYDFNNQADGIRSASRIYFGKEPKNLSTEEAATLVGMLKNSSLYNPMRNPQGVVNRRNVVLSQMCKNGYLTQPECDSLQKLPLKVKFTPETHNKGIATYFREYLRSYMRNWINKNPKPDGGHYNLYLDGLKIYTTLDSRMQTYAEQAVYQHMKQLQKAFDAENNLKKNPNAPFLNISKEEIQRIMSRSMRNSNRWQRLKALGMSDEQIIQSFNEPTRMKVFSWKGDIDTVMTPKDSIRYYKSFLRTGVMSMEPQTGFVKAWVGGINYQHFQYDQVYQGARQVGSAFKPFVYATAIDQLHYNPCDEVPDIETCIEAGKYGNLQEWCPKNSNGKFSGEMMTLKKALANSVNSITVNLMDKVGPLPVKNLVRDLGVTSDIPEVPSIALGTPDITVMEMVGAYSTFANAGVYVKPVLVTRIEDRNGIVLFEYTPETKDVLSADVAQSVIQLLEGVTQSGSGARLRTSGAEKYNPAYKVVTGYPYQFTNPIAGKTGTTQNQSDGWFMGLVPNLVTGVWVGGEDRAIHFRGINYGQGATMALPIWALYMKHCYADASLSVSKEGFYPSEDSVANKSCDSIAPATRIEDYSIDF